MTEISDATKAQWRASYPEASAWVRANAGSGKTRVLTNRVARLLIDGCVPEKILCLTYTKAAAAEMQSRLFRDLGALAMAEREELRAALIALGEVPEARNLREVRRLFARAVEAPGGLKIQTIHSFCDSILRRFPLEVGIPAGFDVMDDARAKDLQREALEDMIAGDDRCLVEELLSIQFGGDITKLLREIVLHASGFLQTPAPEIKKPSAPLIGEEDLPALRALSARLMASGDPKRRTEGQKLAGALREDADPLERFDAMVDLFLTGPNAAQPFSPTPRFPVLAILPKDDPDYPTIQAFKAELAQARAAFAQNFSRYQNDVLHNFASRFLELYDRLKRARGLLDHPDQIQAARRLLCSSDYAQWVLYKLEGGINHILVDEAQDTSRDQWEIISALTSELRAEKKEARARSLFVVGDEKQSIFSFQGASPTGFSRANKDFGEAFQAAQNRFEDHALVHSFRSSPAISRLTDQVFTDSSIMGMSDKVAHISFHAKMPGRIDLWPFYEDEKKENSAKWYEIGDRADSDDPVHRLTLDLVEWIKTLFDTPVYLPRQEGGARPIEPRDILILLQERKPYLEALTKALAEAGIPVAGRDRLDLIDNLAVKDIISVLKFLDLPEDDLSLAEALRSPIFGLSEKDLFDLAHERGEKTLYERLRASDAHQDCVEILQDLLSRTDFERPFELIMRLLAKHKGEARLISRLGGETRDAIAAFLEQSLKFEEIHTPHLSVFLNWILTSELKLKRELTADQNQIRIMTIHGAKGLEAPIVVLPDTNLRKKGDPGRIFERQNRTPHMVSSGSRTPLSDFELIKERDDALEAERMRLLYVAITRAESWLVIAGAGKSPKTSSRPRWYDLLENAFSALSKEENFELAVSDRMKRLSFGGWPSATSGARHPADHAVPMIPPKWQKSAQDEMTLIAPSGLPGEKYLEGAASDGHALRRGADLHHLLETLPKLQRSQWKAYTASLGMDDATLAKASNLIDHPSFRRLFETGVPEVPLSVTTSKGQIYGTIDLLVQSDDRLLLIDFKSNAKTPETADQIPLGILRQIAAYDVAMEVLFPGQLIESAVFWTEAESLMRVPKDLIRETWENISIP